MSYEPTVWKDGDLVTSAKLNKIEQGISNNTMIVETRFVINDIQDVYYETIQTAEEIKTAFCNGIPVIIHFVCNEDSINYLCITNVYSILGTWQSASLDPQHPDYEERFVLINAGNMIGTEGYVNENGKIQFSVYID